MLSLLIAYAHVKLTEYRCNTGTYNDLVIRDRAALVNVYDWQNLDSGWRGWTKAYVFIGVSGIIQSIVIII